MSPARKLRGRLTKVEEKSAFASTSEGDVFIPLSASRIGKEVVDDLKQKFREFCRTQDEVELTVKEQPPKSGCKFIATKIKKARKMEPTEVLPETVHENILCTITNVTDSFAFADALDGDFGNVFIPGDAFDISIVKNIEKYIDINDCALLSIKRQPEMNGCKWQAVKVTKFEDEPVSSKSPEPEGRKLPILNSHGVVMEVTEDMVSVWDQENLVEVKCSQLTYTGGLRGNYSAKTLKELIKVEELVVFRAIKLEDKNYKVISWKPAGCKEDEIDVSKKVMKVTTDCQTSADDAQLLLKAILQDNPEYLEKFKQLALNIPQQLIPYSMLPQEDYSKFDGWNF